MERLLVERVLRQTCPDFRASEKKSVLIGRLLGFGFRVWAGAG
jgi:hypothetical protein